METANELISNHSIDLGAHGLAGEAGAAEGILTRKHDWESTTKKASNRSWEKVWNLFHINQKSISCIYFYHFVSCLQVYVVARNTRLTFFKDQKASKSTPEQTFRGEVPLVLDGANVDVEDHKKRKHVFRVK